MLVAGAHQMEPPSLFISWVNPFPSRFINRTIFFCHALESHECAFCLLSLLYFHWLFPLSARETSPGNRSIYKTTRERVDSKGLYGRCRLHLMGSCYLWIWWLFRPCWTHINIEWHNLFELMQKRIRSAAAFNFGSTQQLWSYGLASVQYAFYDETAVHGFPWIRTVIRLCAFT